MASGINPLFSVFLSSSSKTLYSSITSSPLNIALGSTLPKSPSLFLETIFKTLSSSSSDNGIPAFINGSDTGIVRRESISRIFIISLTFFSSHSVSWFSSIALLTIFFANASAFLIFSK